MTEFSEDNQYALRQTAEGETVLPPTTESSSLDIYRPSRKRTRNEVEVTFYCSRDRIQSMMDYRHVFGDKDFTRSLSRFLTAGVHWMDEHGEEVFAARALTSEIERLRLTHEQLEVDISIREQQKRTLAVTVEQMSYNKRAWWQRLFRV